MNSFAATAPQSIPTPVATAGSSRRANSSRSNSRPASATSSPLSEADLRTSRRRAQNRIAQRTYRARKENTIREHEQRSTKLEKEVAELRTHNAKLQFGIHCLKNQVMELQNSVHPLLSLTTTDSLPSLTTTDSLPSLTTIDLLPSLTTTDSLPSLTTGNQQFQSQEVVPSHATEGRPQILGPQPCL
ncbi:hypothetical protein DV737_g406, partial [Chaetothyriales sp. CBS 132003]